VERGEHVVGARIRLADLEVFHTQMVSFIVK
jgi:hypothetical protein